jgi:hypothetical protein
MGGHRLARQPRALLVDDDASTSAVHTQRLQTEANVISPAMGRTACGGLTPGGGQQSCGMRTSGTRILGRCANTDASCRLSAASTALRRLSRPT